MKKFRKAADVGNLVVIAVAIGVLVIIGLYLASQNMMTKTSNKQNSIYNAVEGGLESLKNM